MWMLLHPLQSLSSILFYFLFFQFLISKTYLQLSLFLFPSLSLTHKKLSLSLSQTNSLSLSLIDHWWRTKARESWPFKSAFMHATQYAPSLLVLLPISKNMQLSHHMCQIGVLHFRFVVLIKFVFFHVLDLLFLFKFQIYCSN